MKNLVKIEEFSLFLLGIYTFSTLSFEWWWFPLLILVPDLSMIGYLFGNKVGAVVYNIFHHRTMALLLYFCGLYLNNPYLQLSGVLMFSHVAMDRMFGYGLKFEKGFNHTHLGKIGKIGKKEQ